MTEARTQIDHQLTQAQLMAVVEAGDNAVDQVGASGTLLTDGTRESVRRAAESAEFAEQLSVSGIAEAISRLRAVTAF